ncbi:uncharacterized protein LOC142167839 [Nicotiana tabacum]|uniref:Uncharacterized protein LOC142167839 n=1 Tax=Nicotiana tabacum TaxID=4097 RepID=A0AC58SGJ6_TOBAC
MATKKIDHTDPLFLQYSDTPGLILIPIQLKGSENYGLWSRSMRLPLKDAHAVWEDLHERFDKVNRVRIFQLHREISRLSQGADSVVMYFTKLKELWAEYDVLVLSPNCGCPKFKENMTHLQQQRDMQFLDGLNDTYDEAHRQIMMKTTEPTLNQAYALIIQDESQ